MFTTLELPDLRGCLPISICDLSRITLLVGKNGVGKTRVLDAVRSENVVALDNIEHGVHHTGMVEMWRHWLSLACGHDLQIFATTHSWECIVAFATALDGQPPGSGVVIRLECEPGWEHMGAVVIDQEKLPYVVRDCIEIR